MMPTAPEQRTANPGDVIRATGPGVSKVLHTFTTGEPAYAIGINGFNVSFTVGGRPTASTFVPRPMTVTAGTAAAQFWANGAVLLTLAVGTTTFNLPGNDLIVTVVAAPTPTTPPVPPAPPGTNVIRVGNSPLTLKSNAWYAPPDGQKTFPVTHISIPSNTANVNVYGAQVVGTGSGYGIEARGTTGLKNIHFEGGMCQNWTDGASIHAPKIEGPCVHQNISFKNWHMLDMGGPAFNAGQGFYLANIDGLLIEECFGDKLGNGDVGPGTHFAYIAAGNRNVTAKDNFVSRAEAVGFQARGPLVRFSDPDDGKDPGPIITGNVLYDCAIGIMVNGPRATVRDNVILAGHHSKVGNTGGECAVYASVGQLRITNTVRAHSPVKDTGTMIGFWFNHPRSDAAVDAGVTYQWGWSNACATVEDAGNVDKLGVVVDLSDLVTRGRNGEPVAPLVAEAQKRVRAAAGVP